MQTLTGKHISLRALEPEDLDFLYRIENNENFWEVSHTQAPFSKFILKQYLENSHLDIYEAKQLRLVIEENQSKKSVGTIDIFDFNPQHKRAGIGVLLIEDAQQKGYATETLLLITKYCFTYLHLHQLYANITTDNNNSLRLFEKLNFKQIGVKKDWIFTNGKFKDEILLQRIHD